MVIFKYELKNHRKYILSWTITLAICIFIMIPIYYSLLGSAESSSNPLYDTLGKTDFFQSMHMQIHIIPKEPLMELWKNGWNTRKMK